MEQQQKWTEATKVYIKALVLDYDHHLNWVGTDIRNLGQMLKQLGETQFYRIWREETGIECHKAWFSVIKAASQNPDLNYIFQQFKLNQCEIIHPNYPPIIIGSAQTHNSPYTPIVYPRTPNSPGIVIFSPSEWGITSRSGIWNKIKNCVKKLIGRDR